MPAKKSTGTKSTAKKSGTKTAASTTKKRSTSAEKSGTDSKVTTGAKSATSKSVATKKSNGKNKITVDPNLRQQMIAEAAYYIAESRGFVGGTPESDWVKAETQIDRLLHQQH